MGSTEREAGVRGLVEWLQPMVTEVLKSAEFAPMGRARLVGTFSSCPLAVRLSRAEGLGDGLVLALPYCESEVEVVVSACWAEASLPPELSFHPRSLARLSLATRPHAPDGQERDCWWDCTRTTALTDALLGFMEQLKVQMMAEVAMLPALSFLYEDVPGMTEGKPRYKDHPNYEMSEPLVEKDGLVTVALTNFVEPIPGLTVTGALGQEVRAKSVQEGNDSFDLKLVFRPRSYDAANYGPPTVEVLNGTPYAVGAMGEGELARGLGMDGGWAMRERESLHEYATRIELAVDRRRKTLGFARIEQRNLLNCLRRMKEELLKATFETELTDYTKKSCGLMYTYNPSSAGGAGVDREPVQMQLQLRLKGDPKVEEIEWRLLCLALPVEKGRFDAEYGKTDFGVHASPPTGRWHSFKLERSPKALGPLAPKPSDQRMARLKNDVQLKAASLYHNMTRR